jgi:hypothetical protein
MGNGAKIVLVPDAPLQLANMPGVTSASQVGMQWLEGLSNGGDPVAYYTLWYNQGAAINSWTILEAELAPENTFYTMLLAT